jgi:hypothetical protein
MKLQLHFNSHDWERIKRNWSLWWQGQLERPLVVIEAIESSDDRHPHYASTFLTNFPHLSAREILNLFVARLEATHYLGDAFPRFWPNFGPGIVAAFCGAKVTPAPDTTWFDPSADIANITDLKVAYNPLNPWWQRVLEVTRTAVESWGDQISIGFTDLGGNLDILSSLRGAQQLLLDLHDTPVEVDRLVGEISTAWRQYYEDLFSLIVSRQTGITCWGPCWSTGKGYMLQSDFSYMISSANYARFVMPDIRSCCTWMDHAFYHLDGKGQISHLGQLLALDRLCGVQWVPGDGNPPPEEWLPVLSRIRDAGRLCQVYVTRLGAQKIIQNLGGRGFLVVINETLTPREGYEFLRELGLDTCA